MDRALQGLYRRFLQGSISPDDFYTQIARFPLNQTRNLPGIDLSPLLEATYWAESREHVAQDIQDEIIDRVRRTWDGKSALVIPHKMRTRDLLNWLSWEDRSCFTHEDFLACDDVHDDYGDYQYVFNHTDYLERLSSVLDLETAKEELARLVSLVSQDSYFLGMWNYLKNHIEGTLGGRFVTHLESPYFDDLDHSLQPKGAEEEEWVEVFTFEAPLQSVPLTIKIEATPKQTRFWCSPEILWLAAETEGHPLDLDPVNLLIEHHSVHDEKPNFEHANTDLDWVIFDKEFEELLKNG